MSKGDKLLEKFGEGVHKVKPFDIKWFDLFVVHVEQLVIVRNGKTRTTANFCGMSEQLDKEKLGYDVVWYELPANSVRGFNDVMNKIIIVK